jgi:transposase-like protein
MRQDGSSVARTPVSLDEPFPFGDAEWFRDLDATEERCRAYLEAMRWPEGVLCPRCESSDTARLEARKKFYCRTCRYHFSVTSGTLFHNSHLPTWKWFLTISLMIQSEDGLPANQLVDLLGVTYKTAWFAEHRVRAALQGGRGTRSGAGQGGASAPGESPSSLRLVAPVVPGQTRRGARARVFARPLVGSYQQLELKYLPAYMAETQWRAESRENPYAFRDTVLRLLGGDPLAYAQLVGNRSNGTPNPSELHPTDLHSAEEASAA